MECDASQGLYPYPDGHAGCVVHMEWTAATDVQHAILWIGAIVLVILTAMLVVQLGRR